MPILGRWWFGRAFTRKAAAYAESLFTEPTDEEVLWLSTTAARGDDDHARWELRYLRRALGLPTAQRDALDDRTGSAVAAAMEERFRGDDHIDPSMFAVATQQFNARLAAYGDIMSSRPGAPASPTRAAVTTDERIGQMLLAFAGGPMRSRPEDIEAASVLVSRYLAAANEELQKVFGVVALPEDRAPSELAR
jgi:hypothetical protein